MDKKKAIWIWGLLIALLLLMVFVEINPEKATDESLENKDDEIIYLSYEEEPVPQAPTIEASVQEALPELPVLAELPMDIEEPVLLPPQVGKLAIPSVIINKKPSPVMASRNADDLTQASEPYNPFALPVSDSKIETEQAQQQQDLTYKIFQGQRFNAVLTHAINSDLPGMVVAEVSQDTYGHHSKVPLLPKGSRLVGQYNSRVNVGDTRLYIVWQRAITPNGIDIMLGSPATDRLGQSGSTGYVDTHFWEIFGTSSLLSMMAVGASNLSQEQGEFSNQYQQGVTDALMDTSSTILRGRIQRKPTIHIPQGEIIHVVVAQDLDFSVIKNQQQHIPIF